MRIPCIKCKGSDPSNCGRTFCPIIALSEAQFKNKDLLFKESFVASAPAPFVGRFGYPNIHVGILAPPEVKESEQYDAPRLWAKENFEIRQIANLRSALVNSRFKTQIRAPVLKTFDSKFLDISREVGMASKPVDLEINLSKKPNYSFRVNDITAPMGPNAGLKKVKITSNPKIHTKVDKVVSDTDRKSVSSLTYLFQHDFDENFLAKLLSVGNLGIRKNRKLVPTRWSITAVDDILGKNLREEISNFSQLDFCTFFASYLGNYYLVLCFPDIWSYELFEIYEPKASFNAREKLQYTTDYESFRGRKAYAENCAGGYYTVKLVILEKLKQLKRQASVLVLRVITDEYAMPLGVWVTREATRKAMASKAIFFSDDKLMLKYAELLLKKKFGINLGNILKESLLLKNRKLQSKLNRFF